MVSMPSLSLTSAFFAQSRAFISFRTILLATMFCWLVTAVCAQEVAQRPEPLTNQDVVAMVGLDLSEGVIVDKINAAPITAFDTTVAGLKALKAGKVSDAIIRAMINAHGTYSSLANTRSHQEAAPDEVGVFCAREGHLVQMEPEIVGWQTGGLAKHVATLGMTKGHINGKVMRTGSPFRLSGPLEFVIKAPEGTSATEYQLLELYVKSNRREFRAVTGGILHQSAGAERTALSFNPEKIAPRTWRIRLQDLPAGEYGFLPPGFTSSSIGSSGKMYTFGVAEGQKRQSTVSSLPGVSQGTSQVLQPIAQSSGSSIGAWTDQNPTVRHDGIVLSRVDQGSPAGSIGIQAGDVILAINGHFLYTAAELSNELLRIAPGTRISIRYQRRATIYDNYVMVEGIDRAVDRPAK